MLCLRRREFELRRDRIIFSSRRTSFDHSSSRCRCCGFPGEESKYHDCRDGARIPAAGLSTETLSPRGIIYFIPTPVPRVDHVTIMPPTNFVVLDLYAPDRTMYASTSEKGRNLTGREGIIIGKYPTCMIIIIPNYI